MQIDETSLGFVIVRGKERATYFAFFVDHDTSSWTTYPYGAQLYQERSKAEDALDELRRRARMRRRAAPAENK